MRICTKGSVGFVQKAAYKLSCKTYLFVRYKEYIPNDTFRANAIFDNILVSSPGIETVWFKDGYHYLKLLLI